MSWLGIKEISISDLRAMERQSYSDLEALKKSKIILIKSKLTSEIGDAKSYHRSLIDSLAQQLRSPILMIDHSTSEISGAQRSIHLKSDQPNEPVSLAMTVDNPFALQYRQALLQSDTFYVLLNANVFLPASSGYKHDQIGLLSLFDDVNWRQNRAIEIAGDKAMVSDIMKTVLGKRAYNVFASGKRVYEVQKTIVWDFDDTLISLGGESRPGLSEVWHRLIERNARQVIATYGNERHASQQMRKSRIYLPYTDLMDADHIGPTNMRGGKSYRYLANRLRLGTDEQIQNHMIVIGNSLLDMPHDIEGVVFVLVEDMDLHAGTIEDVVELLDQAGEGSFNQGFRKIYDFSEPHDGEVRSYQSGDLSFSIQYKNVDFIEHSKITGKLIVPHISKISTSKDHTKDGLDASKGARMAVKKGSGKREEVRVDPLEGFTLTSPHSPLTSDMGARMAKKKKKTTQYPFSFEANLRRLIQEVMRN